jgi:acyl-CoA reductase-like NAD-dependent aldehyde dehydrogenase
MKQIVYNWIDGKKDVDQSLGTLKKIDPSNEEVISYFVDSNIASLESAIDSASKAFETWSCLTPVYRGQILDKFVSSLINNKTELAKIISKETGKSLKHSIGEVNAAILQGQFFAGEGMRLYAKTLTSGMENKFTHTVRMPIGIAGLIVPANTPLANIVWKLFPALICGNTTILKASEDAPELAYRIAELTKEASIPNGVVNVIQGMGQIIGRLIVEHKHIPLISFTGSTNVGKWIGKTAGERIARVSLELGGKNPFIVCDDADIDYAIDWCILSSFSNAGQRCAAASRIILFDNIYDSFINKLILRTNSLKLGVTDDDDLGPVINLKQYENILKYIKIAKDEGSKILCGGKGLRESMKGYYIEPTLIEIANEKSFLLNNEIFGPVVTIQRVKNLEEALNLSNNTEYGLTAAIHTKDVDKAMWFAQKIKAGVVNINIGTYGSEPHMPFGGFGLSGNGTREPGVEALDFYSELKNISFLVREKFIQ